MSRDFSPLALYTKLYKINNNSNSRVVCTKNSRGCLYTFSHVYILIVYPFILFAFIFYASIFLYLCTSTLLHFYRSTLPVWIVVIAFFWFTILLLFTFYYLYLSFITALYCSIIFLKVTYTYSFYENIEWSLFMIVEEYNHAQGLPLVSFAYLYTIFGHF